MWTLKVQRLLFLFPFQLNVIFAPDLISRTAPFHGSRSTPARRLKTSHESRLCASAIADRLSGRDAAAPAPAPPSYHWHPPGAGLESALKPVTVIQNDVESKHTSCCYRAVAVGTPIDVTVTVNAAWARQHSRSKQLMSTCHDPCWDSQSPPEIMFTRVANYRRKLEPFYSLFSQLLLPLNTSSWSFVSW